MVAVVNASGYKADLNSLSEGMQTFWPVESDYWDYSKAILRNGITDPDTLSLIDNYYLENPAGDNLYNYADDEAAQKDQNRQLSLFGSVTAGSVDGYVFWGSNYSRAGRLTAKEVADLKAANPELTTLSALNAYRDEVKQLGTLARNVGVLATACGLVEAHNKIKNAAAEGRSVDVVAVRETAKLTAMAAAGRIASGLGLQLLKIPMPQVKALGLAAVAVGLAMAMVNKLWDSYEDDIDDWITENVTDPYSATAAALLTQVGEWIESIPDDIEAMWNKFDNFMYSITGKAGRAIGSFLAALDIWVRSHFDPLIFDLGSGIETTTLQDGVYFNNENNGFQQRTAWVGSDTGILVRSPSGNPVTNGSQMFGTSTSLSGGGYAIDGFAALADLDSNSDGKIDSSDTAWTELRMWVDADSDGISDDGELKTLSEVGVASIGLTATTSGAVDDSGNTIIKTGTYSLVGGGTRGFEDIDFQIDPAMTTPDTVLDLSETIAALPDVSGYGVVLDLQQALQVEENASGSTLKGYVESFISASDETARNTLVDQIIYQWTGVQAVSSTARGTYIDARQLEALEAFAGQGFVDPYSHTADPGTQSAETLVAAYRQLHDYVLANLEIQTNLAPLFNSLIPISGYYSNDWDFSVAEEKILSDLSADRAAGLAELKSFNRALYALDYDMGEGFAAFRSDLAAEGEDVVNTFFSSAPRIAGTAGNDRIDAWTGNQTVMANQGGNDTLIAHGDHVTLYGSSPGALFIGGEGDDQVFYGGSNKSYGAVDTFIAGQGTQLFIGSMYGSEHIYYDGGDGDLTVVPYTFLAIGDSGNQLYLGDGIDRYDVSITYNNSGHILTDGVAGDTVRLYGGFDDVIFTDGMTLDLSFFGKIQHASPNTTPGINGSAMSMHSIYVSGRRPAQGWNREGPALQTHNHAMYASSSHIIIPLRMNLELIRR